MAESNRDNSQRENPQRENPQRENTEKLRHVVRYFYDLQKLRIQTGNRNSKQDKPAQLDDKDKAFMGTQSEGLEALEHQALLEVKRHLRKHPMWKGWLEDQKGCGPTMAGVILSEVDITRANTVSALWAYSGLSVSTESGRAVRRQKGQKSNWNPFLKTKLLGVLAGCMLKANSPWRSHYDNYKHRKQTQIVRCMACDGTGKLQADRKVFGSEKVLKKGDPCTNCAGTGRGPWGMSDGHRHTVACRYMIKMFLLELWTTWRKLEGLPTPPPYSEAKLGLHHGDHAVTAGLMN